MSEIAIPLLILLCLILINGLFVAAEFAIAAVPRARIAQMASSGSSAARRVLTVLRQPELLNRYISTAQVGITLASLGLGMYGEHVLAEWFYEPLAHWGWLGVAAAHTVATVLSVAMLTYLHVVLGEMIPKSLALQAADRAAIQLSGIMALMDRLFLPLTVVLNKTADLLMHLLGIAKVDASARLVSSAELEYIVEESTEGGLLDPEEQLYLENVLDFGERSVGQVMTPRTRMAALPLDASLDDLLATIRDNHYSRYPIYREDRDHVVGILHIKDLARHIQQLAQGETLATIQVETLMRPATFVPETLALEQMLDRFRREHIQIAIAVDEFGGTAGLITLEDLAEEIIGEIQDEFDIEIPPFHEIAPDTLRVRGDLLLDELNQHYELDLTHEEADTVGGLIMATLGRVAQPGETITDKDIRIEVESTEGLAVNTVLIYLPSVTSEDRAVHSEGDTYD
ncbi:MAG: hemolysin family protein [Caldilineaceae bacterium]